jgi:hypothetical protein
MRASFFFCLFSPSSLFLSKEKRRRGEQKDKRQFCLLKHLLQLKGEKRDARVTSYLRRKKKKDLEENQDKNNSRQFNLFR